MADATAIGAGDALAFLMAAGVMYEAIAAACSSPQTTEINAEKRSGTLMKWVYLGVGQGWLLVGIGAWIAVKEGKNAAPVIWGGIVSSGLMLASYEHAKYAGLKNGGSGTEQY